MYIRIVTSLGTVNEVLPDIKFNQLEGFIRLWTDRAVIQELYINNQKFCYKIKRANSQK
jgi:hypothetical protein